MNCLIHLESVGECRILEEHCHSEYIRKKLVASHSDGLTGHKSAPDKTDTQTDGNP